MLDQSEQIAAYRMHRELILSAAENNRWYKTEVRNGPVWDAFIDDFTWEATARFAITDDRASLDQISFMIHWCEENVRDLWYFRTDTDGSSGATVYFTNAGDALLFQIFWGASA